MDAGCSVGGGGEEIGEYPLGRGGETGGRGWNKTGRVAFSAGMERGDLDK